MAEGFVNVTEGTGKKLHTFDRTIGANTVHDEFMLPGEMVYGAYTIYANAISGATAAAHILQIMAGASLNVRVRRIRCTLVGTGAAANRIEIVRLSTAGTGGGAVNAAKLDTADGAVGATGMTLPTVKGTESANIWPMTLSTATAGNYVEWVQLANSKPIIIPAGAANGIALKVSGVAASTFDVAAEIVETSFV